MNMADTAFLSPERPDGLYNLNYGERMIASSLSESEGREVARIINRLTESLSYSATRMRETAEGIEQHARKHDCAGWDCYVCLNTTWISDLQNEASAAEDAARPG